MGKEEEAFPSIDLSTALQPHTRTWFYVCWHLDKSHTEFKHLPWTTRAIRRKNPSDWNPRVPSPVPSSLGITLELIHNTYAWAQKAWDGEKKKKNCSTMTFTQGQPKQLCQPGFNAVRLAADAGAGKSNVDLTSSNLQSIFRLVAWYSVR